MDLDDFELDEAAALAWLTIGEPAPDRALTAVPPVASTWDPFELAVDQEISDLLRNLQRKRLLRGPADLGVIVVDDSCYIVVDLTRSEHPLRLVSSLLDWNQFTGLTGPHAAMAILKTAISTANTVLRALATFIQSCEADAYDQALADSLEVTEGIQAIDTCGCGDPIALYEGAWHHVYNDELRGTGAHDPEP